MKLSTKSQYGTRVLIDLAINAHKGPVQVGAISKRQNISVKYLEQIIKQLKKAELITSVRGSKGGHILAKPPDKITLGQIVRLFEVKDDTEIFFCNQENCINLETCVLNSTWKHAVAVFYVRLDSMSIADFEKECCV